jgi:predicted DNA-binding transcriptional regulator AlpA
MTLDDVSQRIGKSKRTIMRWVDEGRFPQPTTRNGRLILWSDDVIERWSRRGRRNKPAVQIRSVKRKPNGNKPHRG